MNVRDINAATDADLAVMTTEEIKALFNEIMRRLQALGATTYSENRKVAELKRFHDKTKAIDSLRKAESALRAWESGQMAADRQEQSAESTIGLQSSEDPGTVSPGRARLLNSGRAEEIRDAVVADQEAAAAVAAGQEPEKTKGTKMAKKAKAPKAPKAPREKTERKARVSKDYPDDATITKLVDGNPKREGTAAQAAFALYRTGMRVATFVQKVIEIGQDRGAAYAHLRHDFTKKSFIKIA